MPIGLTIGLGGASSGGGSGTGASYVFSYTVVGNEGDLEHLVIALPSSHANATYRVFPSQSTHTNLLGMAVNDSSRSTTQFVLTLSAVATAGDVFSFAVFDHT